MRIYLPSTLAALPSLLATGALTGAPFPAFAVTPELRRVTGSEDEEELEYAAQRAAADASLALLAAAPDTPRRRVVLAADVDAGGVTMPTGDDDTDRDPATVTVTTDVPLTRVVSAHVDAERAEPAVAEALRDPAAGHAEEHELMWYATQELRYLVGPDGG